MANKPDEEFVKEGAQEVTEEDAEKVIDKSEEIKKKYGKNSIPTQDICLAVQKQHSRGATRFFVSCY
jgi:histone H3/H4